MSGGLIMKFVLRILNFCVYWSGLFVWFFIIIIKLNLSYLVRKGKLIMMLKGYIKEVKGKIIIVLGRV